MTKFFLIALGGGIGALSRYLMQGFVQARTPGLFPWGTLAVNLVGCFLIGFLWAVFDLFPVRLEIRLFLITGILGGYTTFSSFGLETMNLIRDGEYFHAALNLCVSNGAGLLLVFVGIAVARVFIKVIR
jgi:CrcB protein